jgi:hypothetical protein
MKLKKRINVSPHHIVKRIKEEERCPLCALLQEEEFSLLSRLQYDVSRSEHVRQSVVRNGSFCDFHFRQFRKIANQKTNALLLFSFAKNVTPSRNPVAVHCMLCEKLSIYEKHLVHLMADLLQDEKNQALYLRSHGVCYLHLRLVYALLPSAKLRKWLVTTEYEHIQRDIPVLEKLTSRSFYDTSKTERKVIPRMVEKFVGRRTMGL